jgi:5-methylcytosine-specific restriction endonuclease McrA
MTTAVLDIPTAKRLEGILWTRTCQWIRNNRNGGHCEICHRQIPREELECHHIVPRSSGGQDVPWNVKLVCPDCHDRIHGRGKYR